MNEEVAIALRNMIDLAGFSLDVLFGTDAGRAELQIEHAKHVLQDLEKGQ